MQLSKIVAKEIFIASTRSEETYFENRTVLFDHINKLLNYYQYRQDLIFNRDEIKGILYIHYLNVLQNMYKETNYEKLEWTGQLSFTFVINDYIKHKRLGVRSKVAEGQAEKQFDFDSKYSFLFSNPGQSNYIDLKRILFGCDLKGRIDLNVIRYINSALNIKTGIEYIDDMHSTHEFWDRYQAFDGNMNSIKELFMKSLSETEMDSNSFLSYIEDNFHFFLMKNQDKTRRKIIKLLFLGMNAFSCDVLKRCIELLNKFIAKDLNFNSHLSEYETSFYGLSADIFKNVSGKYVIIRHSCLVAPEKYSHNVLLLPFHNTLTDLLNGLTSNFISFYIINERHEVTFKHRILNQEKINSDLINFNEEHFYADDLHQIKEFYNAKFLKVNIFEDNHLDEDDLAEHTKKLALQDFDIVSKIDLTNLSESRFEHKFHDLIHRSNNPLYNLKLLRKIVGTLRKVIKKFSLSGLIVKNFGDLCSYIQCTDSDMESLDKLKTFLMTIREKNFKTFNDAIKHDVADPAYVYLASKIFKKNPNFYLIISDGCSFLSLGYKMMINNIIKSDVSYKCVPNTINYLISQVNRNMGMNVIDSNFIIRSEELAEAHNNYIFDKFVTSIRNTLNLIFVRDIKINQLHLSRTSFEFNESRFTIQFLEKLVYLPMFINENTDNYYLPTALIHEDIVQIYLEKVSDKAPPYISFSLKKLYRYFKDRKIIVDYKIYYIREGDNNTRLHNFYEITHSTYYCDVHNDSTVLNFKLVREDEIDITADKPLSYVDLYWNTEYYDKYYKEIKELIATIKEFSKKYETWKPDDFLDDFVTLLETFKIKTVKDIEKLFNLTQIKRKKRNYSILFLLLETFESHFGEYHSVYNFTRSELKSYVDSFKLGPVLTLTPEYGEFVKVGGLAVMIEDLAVEITAYKEEFVVMMPYYNVNKNNEGDYLLDKGVTYYRSIIVNLHDVTYDIGVHTLKRDNITFYFLHHMYLFPLIYPVVS